MQTISFIFLKSLKQHLHIIQMKNTKFRVSGSSFLNYTYNGQTDRHIHNNDKKFDFRIQGLKDTQNHQNLHLKKFTPKQYFFYHVEKG